MEESQPIRSHDRPKKKAALDFLLAGNSVKTNPYLAAFAKTPLVRALQEDSTYDSLRKFANIKKEVTEVRGLDPSSARKTRRAHPQLSDDFAALSKPLVDTLHKTHRCV